ncbi:MAG TPA: GDP-mannose 4,6-dehydratase [Candidatus Binatia bacterium]|nr:GDP-mannose 4,6-dehydratase [Candidatus Binatia bacterium]
MKQNENLNRVLITGCSGFLAAHLMKLLQHEVGNRLFGITEVPGFSHAGVEVCQLDIRRRDDLIRLLADIRPHVIFHLAAVTNVGFAWKNPALTYEINMLGSSNLLEAILPVSPQARVVLMSSAEVYRGRVETPISEDSPVQCQNPYALSKLAMEMLGDLYWNAHHLHVCKLRAFNFTGPGQDAKFVASDFASQIAAIEKGKKEAVIRVGNLAAIRDFSDVRDVARYVQLLGRHGRGGEVYNLCSGRSYAISQILEMLLALAAKPIRVQVEAAKFRPVDNPQIHGDPSRLRSEFTLQPEFTMEKTLSDLLDYWREHPE